MLPIKKNIYPAHLNITFDIYEKKHKQYSIFRLPSHYFYTVFPMTYYRKILENKKKLISTKFQNALKGI